MKTLFIFKSIDLDMTARFEDSTDVLSIKGTWKQQDFGFSTSAKIEVLEVPNDDSIDINSPEMLQYIEMCTKDAETFVCAELSDYDKALMELSEQCRKGKLNNVSLSEHLELLSCKHGKMTFEIIADLFAC